jgi:hypothetical protein
MIKAKLGTIYDRCLSEMNDIYSEILLKVALNTTKQTNKQTYLK